MLLRNLNTSELSPSSIWLEMADGTPTIAASARLCGRAVAGESVITEPLTQEAMALVAAGRGRGMFDIRGDKDGFQSADRFLAVCVEVDADRRLLFRDKTNPRQTIIFLDAFRQLCQAGLMVHHLLRDFSLSKSGFELADTLDGGDFQDLIRWAIEIEH